MKENQKTSLILFTISFISLLIMVVVAYLTNGTTTTVIEDEISIETDAEVDKEVDTEIEDAFESLVFTPIEETIAEPIIEDTPIEIVESELDLVQNSVESTIYLTPNDIELTDEEIYRLAALVQAEADALYECKTAIASLFLNRMYFYEEDFWETLTREGQFVTAWGTLAYAEPEEEAIQAVYDVLENGTTIPAYVMFYKIEGYHDWGDQVGWNIIGTTYFSYSQWQREELEYRLGGQEE